MSASQTDVLELLDLSNKQSKAQNDSIYNDKEQRQNWILMFEELFGIFAW